MPNPQPYRAKNGDITYSVRFRVRGKPNPLKETFGPFDGDVDGSRALAEAEKFARLVEQIGGDAARVRRRAGESSPRRIPTLRTALEMHLSTLSAVTPGTIGEYRRLAERSWMPALGDMTVDMIGREDITTWVGAQRKAETARSRAVRSRAEKDHEKDPTIVVPAPRTWTGKSIENAHALLSDTLSTLVDKGVISKNVARGVPMPSDDERGEMVILTENEFVLVHAAVRPLYQLFVATLYGTGVRFGEATAIQPDQLDLDGRVPILHVTRAWKAGDAGVYLGAPKTKKGRRRIALPEQLVEPLREVVATKKRGELVFTTAEGKRIQSQHFGEREWRPAVARSGVAKTPRVHDLRHTHASMMLAAGMNLKQLQDRLGHESLKTTADTYGHLMPGALEAGAAFATATLAGAMPEIDDTQPQIES